MKLRVKNNSIRLRLTQTEVSLLVETGRVEEAIEFGLEPDDKFIYALEIGSEGEQIRANLENKRLTISIPKTQADQWTSSETIGLKNEQNIGGGKTLRILIEKDFACLQTREGESDEDAFPHPSKEKIC